MPAAPKKPDPDHIPGLEQVCRWAERTASATWQGQTDWKRIVVERGGLRITIESADGKCKDSEAA